MAIRWAVANGNWSNTATWDGGTLPTSADEVYADGKTVTVDQDITVLILRNGTRSGGINGGAFTVSTSRTLTATNGFLGESATGGGMLQITAGVGTTVALIGNISAGALGNGFAAVTWSGAGTVNVTGSVTGANSIYGHGIVISGTGTINITGNIAAHNGNTYGTQAEALKISSGSATVNIVGNVTGSTTGSYAIEVSGNSTINVTGVVTGNVNYGIRVTAANATLTVTGQVVSTGAPGIYSVAGSLLNCSGPFVGGPLGFMPVASTRMRVTQSLVNSWTFRDGSGNPVIMYTADTIGGNPATGDVRNGTVYGPSNELTGTCIIPSVGSVALGVPVDNTIGTAILTPHAIAEIVGAQIAAAATTPGASVG